MTCAGMMLAGVVRFRIEQSASDSLDESDVLG